MSQFKPYSVTQLKPSVSQTAEVVASGKEGFFDFFSNLDSQKILTVIGVAATLGVGSAALYFGSKGNANAGRKRSRVSFSTAEEKKADALNGNTNTTNPEKSKPLQVPPPPAADHAPGSSDGAQPSDEPASAQATVVKKEHSLVLKQCPRGRKTPCIAPFPLKLETFLRVHGIKYEVHF